MDVSTAIESNLIYHLTSCFHENSISNILKFYAIRRKNSKQLYKNQFKLQLDDIKLLCVDFIIDHINYYQIDIKSTLKAEKKRNFEIRLCASFHQMTREISNSSNKIINLLVVHVKFSLKFLFRLKIELVPNCKGSARMLH